MTAVRREACSESRRWRIAVDAMGGDHGPSTVVPGAAHSPAVEQSRATADSLAEFLDAVTAASAH